MAHVQACGLDIPVGHAFYAFTATDAPSNRHTGLRPRTEDAFAEVF